MSFRSIVHLIGFFWVFGTPFELHANWDEVRKKYDQSRPSEAIQVLDEALARGEISPDFTYFYNRGNLFFQNSEWGKAVAYFEKATRLDPFDLDALHNLKVATLQLKKERGLSQLDPSASTFEKLLEKGPWIEMISFLGLLCFISSLLLFFRKKSRFILWVSAGLHALFLLNLGAYFMHRSSPMSVMVTDRIIRGGPGEHFAEIDQVRSGMKVRLVERKQVAIPDTTNDKKWHKIRYRPGSIGWVPEESLLHLESTSLFD